MRFDLAALRVRLRDLKARTEESAVRGDVRKLIDDLTECARDNKFEGKKALLHFFMDAARGLNLASVNGDGVLVMSSGMRWHESTHRIFEVLKHYGGPRSHRWVQKNLLGMHLRTTEKRWAANLHHYSVGVKEDAFEHLARFYKQVHSPPTTAAARLCRRPSSLADSGRCGTHPARALLLRCV